jgi:multiple sugar transport system permease protein
MTLGTAPPPATGAAVRPTTRVEARRRIGEAWYTPYLFILPHLFLFGIFIAVPFFAAIWLSVQDYRQFQPSFFVGAQNYLELVDPLSRHFDRFWTSLWNTVIFVIISTPTLVLAGLGLAALLNERFRGRNVFRAIYFAPWTLSVAVIALLWWWIFAGAGGLATTLWNATIGVVTGAGAPNWLTQNPWAWLAILITTLWWTIGFNTVILLAGMQGISRDLYEAAAIDGASKRQQFRYVTIPMLRPVLLLVVTLQVIASFNLVGQPQIMTGGGPPPGETTPVLLYIYNVGFTPTGPYDLSQAATMALIVALLMIVVSVINFRVFRTERA